MGVYIKGMEMPTSCDDCFLPLRYCPYAMKPNGKCPIVPVPKHGDLIERDALRKTMYHEAFETDTPMQKWDSGFWIRYKMFENNIADAPTIIPAEKGDTK